MFACLHHVHAHYFSSHRAPSSLISLMKELYASSTEEDEDEVGNAVAAAGGCIIVGPPVSTRATLGGGAWGWACCCLLILSTLGTRRVTAASVLTIFGPLTMNPGRLLTAGGATGAEKPLEVGRAAAAGCRRCGMLMFTLGLVYATAGG